MQLYDLRQIHGRYDFIYLSPHLDDAALSCGGAIARHAADAKRVLVVTLCTAIPPAGTTFSAFAEEMHAAWGLRSDEAIRARLHEDTLAMERLGADSLWANFLDAIYRMPQTYVSHATLFGTPSPDDPLLPRLISFLSGLRGRIGETTFYAPLGIGSHVDHVLTTQAAAALADLGADVAYYEDVPYVYRPGALEARMAELAGTFVPSVIDIDATLARKLGAISCYSSQLARVFGSADQMTVQVTAIAEAVRPEIGTYGERLWLRLPDTGAGA